MSDPKSKPLLVPFPAGAIRYHRLELEFTGRFNHGQPDLEPVFVEGEAQIVQPAPGLTVTGLLVDCPETNGDVGCVVIDTGAETVAICSAVLRQLVVTNSPCSLEFVSVPLQDHTGRLSWDWEAYELSNQGPRILVTEPHSEQRTAPADTWAAELRCLILPKLRVYQSCLSALSTRLTRALSDDGATDQPVLSLESDLERVKGQCFGQAYRQARDTLQNRAGRERSGTTPSPDTHQFAFPPDEVSVAREIVDRYERQSAHPAIRHELQTRLHQRMQRRARLQETLHAARTEQARIAQLVADGSDLIDQLLELGSNPVTMVQATSASGRHLNLPRLLTTTEPSATGLSAGPAQSHFAE